jgi:proline racemase
VTELILEAPAGLIAVTATCANGKVTEVKFRNVPAFAVHLDAKIEVPGFGTAVVDVAWGGMFFVIAEAKQFGIELRPENGAAIVRASEALRAAAAEQLPVVHPDNPAITGPTISQLTAPANMPRTHGRGAITVSTGDYDPSRPEALTGVNDL